MGQYDYLKRKESIHGTFHANGGRRRAAINRHLKSPASTRPDAHHNIYLMPAGKGLFAELQPETVSLMT